MLAGVLYISERRRGPKRFGARGNLLFTPLLSTVLHCMSRWQDRYYLASRELCSNYLLSYDVNHVIMSFTHKMFFFLGRIFVYGHYCVHWTAKPKNLKA